MNEGDWERAHRKALEPFTALDRLRLWLSEKHPLTIADRAVVLEHASEQWDAAHKQLDILRRTVSDALFSCFPFSCFGGFCLLALLVDCFSYGVIVLVDASACPQQNRSEWVQATASDD